MKKVIELPDQKITAAAVELVRSRLEYFNETYRFRYSRVTIRNQKTRWGSCSSRGHLSFNYKLVMLQPKHADYIIVHELCHLGELNHSKSFWDLVQITMPDHKKIRKELRKIHLGYLYAQTKYCHSFRG